MNSFENQYQTTLQWALAATEYILDSSHESDTRGRTCKHLSQPGGLQHVKHV